MAIPFNLPSDECSLEQYRNIHQLLLDLINLLRALLNTEIPIQTSTQNPVSPPPVHVTQFGFPTPPSSVPSSPSPFSPGPTTTSFVLPDVVASAMNNNDLRNLLNAQLNVPTPPAVEVPSPESRRGSIAGSGSKLRKRKRARLSKKKKCADCGDTHCSFGKCQSSCEQQRERCCKIPKTTGTVCSCCKAVEDVQMRPVFYDRVNGCGSDVPRDSQCCVPQTCRRTASKYKSPTWAYVGEELRRMTDGLDAPKKDEKIPEDMETTGNGLISQCGRTVFAAALLVLGWKLLRQN